MPPHELKDFNDPKNYGSNACARPTHALAIEWLRVNFGLWIEICISKGGE